MFDASLSTNPHAARNFALQLLARRDHCQAELVLKLIRQGFERNLAAQTIDALVAEKVVDDARYMENFIAYQAGQGFGPARIGYKLRAPDLNLNHDLINQALSDEKAWVRKAAEVREKKFGPGEPQDFREKVKQAYYLQHRGFTTDQIRLVMGTDIEIDEWKE